jgi:hypothetical protein
MNVFTTLRDHLLVELTDAKNVQAVLSVLLAFLRDPLLSGEVAAFLFVADDANAAVPFAGVLGLVYPDGETACQDAVAQFLSTLLDLQSSEDDTAGSQLAGQVFEVVQGVVKQDKEKFADTPLAAILQQE